MDYKIRNTWALQQRADSNIEARSIKNYQSVILLEVALSPILERFCPVVTWEEQVYSLFPSLLQHWSPAQRTSASDGEFSETDT